MKLRSDERDLVGSWILSGGRVVGDSIEQRIDWLVTQHLEKIGSNIESGGWDALYRDPEDGRYWELTYPQSEMHGGGPRRLTNISAEMAVSKYQDNSTGFLDLQ